MSSSDELKPLSENGFGQHRGGGGPIPSNIVGFAGSFLDQLSPHVFNGICQLNIFCNCHSVLGHTWAAPSLVEDGIAPTGPQSSPDRSCQLASAGQQFLPGLVAIHQVLCSHRLSPLWSVLAGAPAEREPSTIPKNTRYRLPHLMGGNAIAMPWVPRCNKRASRLGLPGILDSAVFRVNWPLRPLTPPANLTAQFSQPTNFGK